MSKSHKGRILISGAGVAGLSAALELAARGWSVQLFEKAASLSEVGAGLQLAPNAMRHLERLGVAKRLSPQAVAPETLYLMDGRKVRPLLEMKLGTNARARWGFPYLVCHRADLQSALLAACMDNDSIEINLDAEIRSHSFDGQSVNAQIHRGEKIETIQADYILACDGVWSTQRAQAGLNSAQFSGYIAWRSTIPASALPDSFIGSLSEKKAVSAWLGPKAHFIAYPVKGGNDFNFVAITSGDNPGQDWSKTGDREQLQPFFTGWSKPVLDIIASAPQWTYWPLFQMPDLQFSCANRLIFLGDASHAVTPFAAQGAAMAIEDAAALAEALDAPDQAASLEHFNTIRKNRLTAVAKRGAFNRFAYHATGLFALGRNMLFAARPSEAFIRDMDWLYAYDAIAAVRD